MIEATLANLRNSKDFFKTEEIIHIRDGRKKEDIGFFVPQLFQREFFEFVEKMEYEKKMDVLKRVAAAQELDPIEEGCIADGIE